MKVKIMVGGNEIKYDIHDELYFDPEHVFDVIGKQAGLVAWWSSLQVMKQQELDDAQVKHERSVAQLDKQIRDSAAGENRKITEASIKAEIAMNPKVEKALIALNKLKRDVGFLKAMARAFDSRGALLATAGSAQRAELEARLRAMAKGTAKETRSLGDSA